MGTARGCAARRVSGRGRTGEARRRRNRWLEEDHENEHQHDNGTDRAQSVLVPYAEIAPELHKLHNLLPLLDEVSGLQSPWAVIVDHTPFIPRIPTFWPPNPPYPGPGVGSVDRSRRWWCAFHRSLFPADRQDAASLPLRVARPGAPSRGATATGISGLFFAASTARFYNGTRSQ